MQHDAASQQTALEMDFGKVRSKVVKVTQPNGKFEMKTPNAVIGVIGTDFYVSYEAKRTTVVCYTGKVWVTPIGDAKVVKNSGQADQSQIIVSAGQMVAINAEGCHPNIVSSLLDTEADYLLDNPPALRHSSLDPMNVSRP